MERLKRLKMKLNEARNFNNQEVINEEKRLTDGNFKKTMKFVKW